MRAITLTQPWATLVAIRAKTIETRNWITHYRGQIAIHAAKAMPDDARYMVTEPPFSIALGGILATELPRASIIALATIDQCWEFGHGTEAKIRERSAQQSLPPFEADFGDYTAGRYGFRLVDVILLPKPVPARGMLNLWNVPTDVERQVREQIAA